jgi:hypothetical protein
LFVAFVAFTWWQVSQPPYPFMKGAKFWFSESEGDGIVEWYLLDATPEAAVKSASGRNVLAGPHRVIVSGGPAWVDELQMWHCGDVDIAYPGFVQFAKEGPGKFPPGALKAPAQGAAVGVKRRGFVALFRKWLSGIVKGP